MTTIPKFSAKFVTQIKLSPGSKITIPNITSDEFEDLLEAFGENRAVRLTYYRETLEIIMPSDEHEFITRMIDIMIRVLCRESGFKIRTLGSTRLKTLQSSPEPDNEYYIQNAQNAPSIKGTAINLTRNIPPDLVVEVNITHSDIDKKEMYQEMRVPEFWSYDGKTGSTTFYSLQANQYQAVTTSPTFPFISPSTLRKFINQCLEDEFQAEDLFRVWVQQQRQAEAPTQESKDLFS